MRPAFEAPELQPVTIPLGALRLNGDLAQPPECRGLVVFAHGSGSSRLSPRNRFVAGILQQGGLATLLFDLLTTDEEAVDLMTMHFRFDVDLLAERLQGVTDWLAEHPDLQNHPIGYFGASTGAAAALIAAANRPKAVAAVVSRGGRPDLAGAALPRVVAPTLLIVGGDDHEVIALNRAAFDRLYCPKHLAVVPGASHLFTEPGTLEQVAGFAQVWFRRYLQGQMLEVMPA